jgi:hypothetical protein
MLRQEAFKGTTDISLSITPAIKSPDEAVPFKKSFDTTSAIAAMYLWLLFGFFSSLLGCDLQRAVINNMYIKHILAITTFFFLMTVIDADNQTGIAQTWLKTLVVYVVFLMSTKSKLLASITVLFILIIDQTILLQIKYDMKQNPNANTNKLQKVRQWLLLVLIAVVFIGYVHYFIRARREFGTDFSYPKFVFGTIKCAHL